MLATKVTLDLREVEVNCFDLRFQSLYDVTLLRVTISHIHEGRVVFPLLHDYLNLLAKLMYLRLYSKIFNSMLSLT